MILPLLFIALLCLSIWARVRWTSVRAYWKLRGVPHQPPHPIFGNLTFLVKQDPGSWLRESKDLYRYPFIGIWLFWRPALLVNCPEIARQILVADSDNFRDRLSGSGTTDPYGSLNLFMVNEPTWSSIRRRLTPVFTSAKLKAVESLVQTKCSQLVQRIHNGIQENNNEDLRTIYSDLTTDIISKSAFGVDGDATLTGKSAMKTVALEELKYGWHRKLSWFTVFFLPELTDVLRSTFFPKSNIIRFRNLFNSAVMQRGGYGKETKSVSNFFDALIKIKQEALKEGEDMSEDLLIAQAAIFFLAGLDTSALTLMFATYELAFAPNLQEQLFREISEAKQNAGGKLETETLKTLAYLNGVINETLRKYPVVAWLDRIASKDYQFNKDLKIAAGTPVYINLGSIHNNPEYFPDPDKFIPERFLPENADNLKPFTHLPFGEGPRHCIGMRFARQTLQNALSTVILNFHVRPLPTTPKPEDCPIDNKGLALVPRDALYVEFVPRK